MSAPAEVVKCRNLVRTFGDQTVLDGVDLDVAPGTIVGLIGPSGCGKTTLIRILLGVREPTSGTVEVLGRQPDHFSASERARVGYMPQLPSLFPNLSIWNNLRFAAALYGVRRRGRRQRLRQLLDFVGLGDDGGKLLGHASGGMQRRLALAAALVHDPALIVLDEPTAGIDPILRERFWTHFQSLRDAGRTLIVSTQYVGEAADCDVVAVMFAGRVLAFDTPDGLRHRRLRRRPDRRAPRRAAGSRARTWRSWPPSRSCCPSSASATALAWWWPTPRRRRSCCSTTCATARSGRCPSTRCRPTTTTIFVQLIEAANAAEPDCEVPA